MTKLGESFVRWLAELTTMRPWLVLGISLVLTALAAYASTNLSIDTSTDNILASDLPFRQNERAYKQAFPPQENFIVVVDAASPDDAQRAANSLGEKLRSNKAAFQYVEVPAASEYFQRNALLFLPPDQLSSLGGQIGQARPLLLAMARDPSIRGLAGLFGGLQVSSDPSQVPEQLPKLFTQMADAANAAADGREARVDWAGFFQVGKDGRSTRQIVVAKPIIDNTSLERAEPALAALRTDIASVQSEIPNLRIRVTGDPALRQQELNDAFSGAVIASGLSFILVALSLVLGIRSGRLIAALLITLVIGSVWTTGLAALAIGQLNLISVAFLVLFFGLGVDFGTHLGLRYMEEARAGAGFKEALKRAMAGEGPGITLSAVCATLAFLSFVPTDYTGLAEFGVISALGMLVAVVITFTVQPALMALMPPKVATTSNGRGIGIGRWIVRWPQAILVGAVIITAGSIYYAAQAQIDVNPLNLQDPRTEPVQTYRDLAHDPNTSPYSLDVLVPDAAAAQDLSTRLAAIPGVGGVRSMSSFVPTDQPEKLEILEQLRNRLGAGFFQPRPVAPPDETALTAAIGKLKSSFANIAATAAQGTPLALAAAKLSEGLTAFEEKRGEDPSALRALDKGLVGNFPDLVTGLRGRLSVSQEVTAADLPADLREDWVAKDGRLRLQVQPATDIGSPKALESFAERVQAVAPTAVGLPVGVTEAGKVILWAFAEAIAYTVVTIALVVIFLRRRLLDVILVLAPLALAALWTVAGSTVLGVPFNFANVIVIPLLIGLGVASSVHIVVRARELEHGHGPIADETTQVLDTSTPLAVLVAQLNTVAAFATLAVSHHRGLYSMGLLLGMSILFVLIVSLVILPAAMVLMDRRRDARRAAIEKPA